LEKSFAFMTKPHLHKVLPYPNALLPYNFFMSSHVLLTGALFFNPNYICDKRKQRLPETHRGRYYANFATTWILKRLFLHFYLFGLM
jgi:hypothetical protein